MDAETLGGHLASYFKVEGSAPVSHTHDYLVAISSNDKVWKVVPVVSDTGDVTWESIEII